MVESLTQLVKAIEGLIQKRPEYFVLLVILFALLIPFYQKLVDLSAFQYITVFSVVFGGSMLWLFTMDVARGRQRLVGMLAQISDKVNTLEQLARGSLPSSHVKLVEGRRQELEQYFMEHLFSSKRNVDIIAFTGESLTQAIEKMEKDSPSDFQRLLDKIVRGGFILRILLLEYPLSTSTSNNDNDSIKIYWQHRAKADERGLEGFEGTVKYVKEYWLSFAEKLKKRCEGNSPAGSIAIRYYSHIPCYAYLRADDVISFGLYFNFKKGKESPNFEISSTQNNTLYVDFHDDFKALWRQGRDNSLTKFDSETFL